MSSAQYITFIKDEYNPDSLLLGFEEVSVDDMKTQQIVLKTMNTVPDIMTTVEKELPLVELKKSIELSAAVQDIYLLSSKTEVFTDNCRRFHEI